MKNKSLEKDLVQIELPETEIEIDLGIIYKDIKS